MYMQCCKEYRACVPEELQKVLNSNPTGQVVMVNSSGVYLRFEEQIVFLCDITWGLVPIGIAVDGFKKMVKQLQLETGQSVTVNGNKLIFPNGTVCLQMESKNLDAECPRQPKYECIRQAALELASLQKEHGISMLVEPLVLGKRTEKSEVSDIYYAKAHLYLDELSKAMLHESEDDIRCCVDKMLGLGIGLTPSIDDVIMGMLYVFRKLPQKKIRSVEVFRESILQMCDGHTNQISSTYLKAILCGAPFERMENVWQGLCGIQTLNIAHLTQVGSSSGTEMLLGMLIALRICGFDVSS